ncbi:MAG: ribonuclease H family protein [Prevotellaceae bacterium]|jgi:ribonuclease HI|nr:ribonuclease H family protein [Prevotellaceae bacterium]
MAKNNFYVVWRGRNQGVFDNWAQCKASVEGFEDAKYKGFATQSEAQNAFLGEYEDFVLKRKLPKSFFAEDNNTKTTQIIEIPSIAVDAACSGNPGDMEYRGVWTRTGEEIFRSKVYRHGTNNIGEFLAIIHALALLKKNNSNLPIYSDSINAQMWVKNRKCKTKLVENTQNSEIFELIRRAEIWLEQNSFLNKIYKWDTQRWGEIPADYGRK